MEKEILNRSETASFKVEENEIKYLFICGLSMSGVGKGTTISALGNLLVNQGNIVTAIKIDPYLNVDAGTMAPSEHGEVYVLEDGGEVDLDLGNYERALNAIFSKDHNITSGKVFSSILNDERMGNYLGKTIQMVPHVTDRIQKMIQKTAMNYRNSKGQKANICLVEIGGTVGDLESGIFFEALRQFINKKGENCAIIVLSYVPMIGEMKEGKTKPTQHGIKDLKSLGLFPNFIICRSDYPLNATAFKKISDSSNIPLKNIGNAYNVPNLYSIPLILNHQGIDKEILNYFKLKQVDTELTSLKLYCKAFQYSLNLSRLNVSYKKEINIVLFGKYSLNTDAYYSVFKSLEHASLMCNVKANIIAINADLFDDFKEIDDSILNLTEPVIKKQDSIKSKNNEFLYFENKPRNEIVGVEAIKKYYNDIITADGILIPGGFGKRGAEAKIKVIKIAREKKIPYLGICYGMQLAVVEFCRNVLGLKTATSMEIVDDTNLQVDNQIHPVITTMNDTDYVQLGGTLRLGAKNAIITPNTLVHNIYGETIVKERHRHRYEVNNDYVERIENQGMLFTGRNEEGDRMDMLEIKDHPFFFGTQSHPEFKTNPKYPSLPFYAFILHSSGQKEKFELYAKEKRETVKAYTGFSDYDTRFQDFDRSYFERLIKDISEGQYK